MLFNTLPFAVFFCFVWAIYVALPHRAQNVFLLLASWFFYAVWNFKLLALLVGSTACGYFIGLRVEKAVGAGKKRWLLLGLAVDLGVLGLFKYFDFFAASAADVLAALGIHVSPPALKLVLPVGISFYTFQSIAYNVEVYKGRMRACRDPILYALFIAYFPHLVAGPIQRPLHLLPQLAAPRTITWEKLSTGATLVFIGLVRKSLVADVVAPVVDKVFDHPQKTSSFMLARALLLFALQIYGDFAGYTDMARGISRMMGVELTRNFDHPYFATTISDFWRRWHISLSSWLRDYVFIPLGGSRRRPHRTYFNLMTTMLLGGLWHGASWTFVIWGAFHGAALVAHAALRHALGTKPGHRSPWPLRIVSGFVTMAIVLVGWTFFRAKTYQGAIDVLHGIYAMTGEWPDKKELILPGAMVAIILLIDLPQHLKDDHEAILRWPFPLRGSVYAALTVGLLVFAPTDPIAFIYFAF
jgi:D-alanyl-lipoteichoic acid acyltransferase DltB (MBOAT superfamily)